MASRPPSSSGRRAAGITRSRRPGRRPTLATVIAAAVVTAGLLSLAAARRGDPTDVAAVVARDNTICQRYGAQLGAIAPPAFDPTDATGADLPAAAGYLDQVIPRLQAELAELRRDGQPDTDRDLRENVLTALSVIGDEQAADTAAHAGDLTEFQAAVRADAQDATHVAGTAHQFGLAACAS